MHDLMEVSPDQSGVKTVSDLFASEHEGRLRFCRSQQAWFIYEAGNWQTDKRHSAFNDARLSIRGLHLGASWGTASLAGRVLKQASTDARLAGCAGLSDRDECCCSPS